ncbi:hypothetical protein AAG570_013654 [Ranatra chinensis]|uniref:Uncharacterized protein n=1 Tax=Ranatra chinensis TaxID=642074 RepID=A0ABD0YCT5_9HEMI
MASKRRNMFYEKKKQETTGIERISALGRHLQLERMRVITVQLAPKRVIREQEAGDDGKSQLNGANDLAVCLPYVPYVKGGCQESDIDLRHDERHAVHEMNTGGGGVGGGSQRKSSSGRLERPPESQWNVQVVKVKTRCFWNACKALSFGLVLMLIGTTMATLGT